MAKEKIPTTQALRLLRRYDAKVRLLPYRYEEKGGTEVAARELGVAEHRVIKTIVMEDDQARPFLVLMHGDKRVSAKNLARAINVKRVSPCDPAAAYRHTGYKVGGISPFGTKRPLSVYMEESIKGLEEVYINAGKRGLLAAISPDEISRILNPRFVEVAV